MVYNLVNSSLLPHPPDHGEKSEFFNEATLSFQKSCFRKNGGKIFSLHASQFFPAQKMKMQVEDDLPTIGTAVVYQAKTVLEDT